MTPVSNPRVSVIIPVHNTSAFLDECLGSVFAQTLSQDLIEVIAVDDGSTDDSLEILRRLAGGRGNVHVVHQDASGSAARPRNVGIDASRGDYLFFLDSDDYLDPETLEHLLALADETGSGLVLPRMTSFGSVRPRASGTVKRTRKAVDFVASGAYRTAHAGKLYRASVVRDGGIRFHTGFRLGEDIPFTYTAGLRSPHVSMLGDKDYYYLRWRGDQTSLRQKGQSADEVLLKNQTIIRTVMAECQDVDARIRLLQRCVMGRGGLWRVFTHPRLDEWDEPRRREAFAVAHDLLASVWEPGHRRSGTMEAHVMTNLIRLGDYDGAMHLADQIEAGGDLPLRAGLLSRQRTRYVSSTGTVVRDVVPEDALPKPVPQAPARA